MLRIVFFFGCIFCTIIAFGQIDAMDIYTLEQKSIKGLLNLKSNVATKNYDVISYRLNVAIDPQIKFIQGDVRCIFKNMKQSNTVTLDLNANMKVDSVKYKNRLSTFSHDSSNALRIQLSDTLYENDIAAVRIFYNGVPETDGLGSFDLTTFEDDSLLWTLSQPYGAQNWWPCKNSLNDKADTVELIVKVPFSYQAASNGLLLSIDTLNNQHRFHWRTTYPIATYLVAVSVGDYQRISYKKPIGEDSLLYQHFLFPTDTLSFSQSDEVTHRFMQFYDSLLGPYPFIKEKYGHASAVIGGGMEHQTMSLMGAYGGELIAHELVHQWFGNKITCASWSDIWLNEGFATYFTHLTYEFGILHDPNLFSVVLKNMHKKSLEQPHFSVFRRDTSEASLIFDRLVYDKGAALLHMLRWQVGDSAFFQGIRNYLNDPRWTYGFVSAKDFQFHLKRSSGKDLSEFFKDWYYGRGYPIYTTEWSQTQNELSLDIFQISSDPSVYFFNMPLPFQLHSGSWDSTIVLDPKFSGEQFNITLSRNIDSIIFDPEQWITAEHQLITSTNELSILESSLKIYPNPTNGLISIGVARNFNIEQIRIVDSNGALVKRFFQPSPTNISVEEITAGVYIIEILSDQQTIRKKLIIQP